ncbi:unnamed protein product [Orchesella dallaii]|uniref:Down syndrome cell adhesion molecule-like protein Dscam2 n=1 Tax=Orchesella dallaii TaxID=48710 RepID=A0ABP1PYZ5_9HEXA
MMKLNWIFWLWTFHLLFISCQQSSAHATTSDVVPGLHMERQLKGPFFTQEPSSRVDFLNEMGARIVCHADGYPKPQIHWQGSDNKIVTNVENFRTVLINSTLILLPFKPAAYRQDIHSTIYRCLASNAVGAIRSRDIQVRAVIAQQWSAKVRMIPRQVPAGSKAALLLKCEVDLMGGGRDFIQVTGWQRDGKLIGMSRRSFYGVQDDSEGRFHLLPNGDLVIHYVTHEDSRSRFVCLTRHKLTDQETSSSFFSLPFPGKSLDHGDETNIAESFPAPIIMIRQGDPLVLHCYELFPSASTSSGSMLSTNSNNIRWEKLTENSWSVIMKSGGIDMPLGSSSSSVGISSSSSAMATMSMFFRQVGSSLVSERSVKAQTGHYRCLRESTKEKIREFDVRVTEPLQVIVTINQEKTPLDSTVELRCSVISSSTSPSIIWLKDTNVINPGGRIRLFSTNVLQINQIQKDDQGMYQCLARTDMESAQASARIELADASPRLIYGFIEQTLAPGPSVSLRCAFTGWPAPKVSWLLDNWAVSASHDTRILIGDHMTSHGHLISYLNISETRVEDGGLYSCKAANRNGTAMHSARLNIYGAPWIRMVPPVVAISSEYFSLNCPIAGWPISFAAIVWEKDGQKLPLNQRHRVASNGTLVIPLVDKSDAGTYWCSIIDMQGRTARREIQVNVVVAPRWLSEPQDVNVSRGSESRFDCVGHGVPSPTASWTKFAGEGIEPQWKPIEKIWPSPVAQGISSVNGSLIFAAVEEVHSGVYMCSVNNGIGSGLSKVVHLHVNVQPYFIGGESQTVSLTLGKTHEVICEAVSSSPIEVTWLKGITVYTNVAANRIHTVVASDGRKTRSTLVMKDIRSDDSGLYHCTASNSLGKVTRTYRLVVEEPPGPPVNLRLLRGRTPEASRVYLEWDAPPLLASETHEGAPFSGLSGMVHVPGDFATSPAAAATTSGGTTTTTTMLTTAILAVASPPILRYVLEFSESSETPSFTKRIEIAGEKTQVKVDNLSPASVYLFRVRAINSAGSGPPSVHLLVRTANVPPSVPPNNVRATDVLSHAIHISWSPIPIEMSYGKVLAYRVVIGANVSEFGKSQVILVPLASASRRINGNNVTLREHDCCQAVIHGLRPYTHYEIRVAALNVAGVGPLSSPFTVKTKEAAPASPPKNAQCKSSTSHSIQISWENPSESNGPVTAHKVIFYPLSTTLSPGMNQRASELHRTKELKSVIGGLQPSTNYSFQISPVNIAGEGRQWLTIFCKTLEDLPSAPTSLIGFPSSESSVYITWLHPRKPNGILIHHTVYYRIMEKPGDSYEIKRTIPANVDSFEENGLDLTRFKYIFWVTSSNRLGESPMSTQLILTPPPIVETRLVGHSRMIITQSGNSLSLPCRILGLESLSSATSSSSSILPPDSAVTWTLNGRRVGFDGTVYMKPGHSSLSFFGVKKEMMGNYTCQLKYSTRGTHSKSTSKKVINGMDHSSTSSSSFSSAPAFPAQLFQKTQLTYSLVVRGPPCIPEPAYELRNRDIYISWRVDGREGNESCDAPLGFILYHRTLGSILDWQKLIFQPTLRNYTLKDVNCGAILNMYMLAFNDYGSSGDSPLMSVVVSQQVGMFAPSYELIAPNVTSVLLNFYSLNANSTYCPTEKIAITLKEWRGNDGVTEKDVKIEFRNEYWIDGLKPSTPYEIAVAAFGYSTSRTASFTFTTLTEHGEIPSEDVLSTHKVTSELIPLYKKLKFLVPISVIILAAVVAIAGALIYCQTKKRRNCEREIPPKHTSEVLYGQNHRKSIPHEEQYYSGLPCPPCTPGMEDISPYATFQISDPKKFSEESFSQEIVVAKFHPVMHGIPRGSRDKWMDPRSTLVQDSEDSESEGNQRYSMIPPQRARVNNTYQISPPQAYHFRQQQHNQQQPFHEDGQQQQQFHPSSTFVSSQHNTIIHQQQHSPMVSVESGEDGCSSSSDVSPTIPTMTERRHPHKKDRRYSFEGERGRRVRRTMGGRKKLVIQQKLTPAMVNESLPTLITP